jgi:photosystem II stability/assembly factor-like uncharacterized protein
MRLRIVTLLLFVAAVAFAGSLALSGEEPREHEDTQVAHARVCAEGQRAEREREEAEREGEEAEREGCEPLDEMGRELQEPGDTLLARQLFGSDTTNPAAVFSAARAESKVLARRTRRQDADAAAEPWKAKGPTNIGGRVLDVAVDPDAKDTLFIATATGGVWKSTDAGTTFSPAWPADQTQAIGALTISPSGVLYAGTGETGPGGGSMSYGGNGLYRSDDRGASWKRIGLENTSRISRVVLDPKNENRIFVAASGPLYKHSDDRGLFLSEDGGKTFTKVLAGDNDTTGAVDVAFDPKTPGVMYAATWDHLREPDKRQYTGVGSGVYKSTDNGRTWTRLLWPGLGPDPENGRPGVAVAPDGTLYVITSGTSGAYRQFLISKDGGTTFTPAPPNPDLVLSQYVYGWWFGRVWVDPRDSQHVFVAGVDLMESKDGGQSWAVATGPAHADQHAMAWDLKAPNRVYLGNDGGLYRSDANGDGQSWKKARSLPFSQLYTIDVGEQHPDRMVAGLQDNGVNRNWVGSKPATDQWNEYHGGDGQRALINPRNEKIIYGCHQYGACETFTDGGTNGRPWGVYDNVDGNVSTRKNWLMPIEFDPEDPTTIYTGGEIMNRSDDNGENFTPISGDLSNGPGRETNPLFRNFGTLTTIAPGGMSTKTIYAGTDDGNLWYTHDQTDPSAWTKASDPNLPKAWVTRVEIDMRDKSRNTAYVTYSGFRQADDAAYILKTTDGGKSWTDISGDLPKAPLNDVNVIGDTVVVASDFGVFYKRPGAGWLKLGAGLPLAPIYELRYHQGTQQLFAATFGRGIYVIDASVLDD